MKARLTFPSARLMLLLALLLVAMVSAPASSAAAQSGGGEAVVVQLDGQLTRAMLLYFERAFAEAAERDAELIIMQLNTPGGEIDLMLEIVTLIRESDIPVVVYVSPRGAVAGSAGTVITLAGHAAAMAPETTIGAASPVGGDGSDLPETLTAKVTQVIQAEIRALAENRGPEAIELAERTVSEAVAVTVTEALAVGLVDYRADDIASLLEQLDGETLDVGGSPVTLDTTGMLLIEIEMSIVEQLLGILANPLLVFSLLALGFQAILIELNSPGGWVAGTLGVVFLALAAYGLGFLSVNWFGIVFILLGLGLLIYETQTPTFGVLTVAGMVSIAIGGIVLFNGPGTSEFQRVSVPGIIAVTVASSAFTVFVLYMALAIQRRAPAMGAESIVGQLAVAQTALNPSGMVRLHGELWRATSSSPVEAGANVAVSAVNGLQLSVDPVDAQGNRIKVR